MEPVSSPLKIHHTKSIQSAIRLRSENKNRMVGEETRRRNCRQHSLKQGCEASSRERANLRATVQAKTTKLRSLNTASQSAVHVDSLLDFSLLDYFNKLRSMLDE
jgi:hypothetical protein